VSQAQEDEDTPRIDPEWIDGVYENLGKLELALDPDPLIYGPKRLNAKVAEARNMLRNCEAVFLQVSHDLHRYSRALRVAQAKLKLAKDYLFANDPETRAGRNVADREAIAVMKLQDRVKEVHRLEIGTEDLKAMLTVIKAKRADLRDTQGRLRDQIRLCQEEIGLGGRWGSRRPNAPEIDADLAPAAKLTDIDELLQSVDDETHLPPPTDDAPDPDPGIESDVTTYVVGEEDETPACDRCGERDATVELNDELAYCQPCFDEAQEETKPPDGEPEGVVLEVPSGETDLDEQLAATASADEVDAFLNGGDEDPPASAAVDEAETDLEDLLGAWED
jgi:hypothetical protein